MNINKIINADCLQGLKELPDSSVNCVVTSPPYFGLRDYGMEGQIGLEETPKQFIEKMVNVFREVKRVLKKDGTVWLNIGDSYNGVGRKVEQTDNSPKQKTNRGAQTQAAKKLLDGMKPKDLIGIPWMLAFALRADGWYLRQDIIWHKPNPMPESVSDRCTKSHEYIFLLSKSQKYYYDADSIKTKVSDSAIERIERESRIGEKTLNHKYVDNGIIKGGGRLNKNYANRPIDANKRSVWTVLTRAFSDAHFATFPEELIVDCIKAGCPIDGIVLDPFMGAGTTALVSRKLNRNFVGFELNPEYIKIAEKRLYNELGMFQ